MDIRKVMTIVGARPQFIKAAIVSKYLRNLRKRPYAEILVHTGQHYDFELSDVFFHELDIRNPKYNLGVGSHDPPLQIGLMMKGIESVMKKENPDAVLVYGDTNSTLAAAISATYRNIPVVHVEAGERIYRRENVPEEINRILTDHASFLCLTCTDRAYNYLIGEGMGIDRVKFVGDPMLDLFKMASSKTLSNSKINCRSFDVARGNYHLCTIHRMENTSDRNRTLSLLKTLDDSIKKVLLPVHPRLGKLIKKWGWKPKRNLKLIKPLGYFDFLNLLLDCDKCITDSGGVTRESFFAGKACIVPMDNCWWTDIVESGWALETGRDRKKLKNAIENFSPPKSMPKGIFGDGKSSRKIVEEISKLLDRKDKEGSWAKHGSIYSIPKEKPRSGEFTYLNYEQLINRLLDKGYSFCSFNDAEKLISTKKKFILMRHDIDMDLEPALHMARIENKLGIKATYFFHVGTDHYNIFSESGSKIVFEIIKLGHDVGMHFDCEAYSGLSVKGLAQECSKESDILERWFKVKVSTISYHRPDKRVLSGDKKISWPRRHTYMKIFNKKIKYVSDSQGKWKYGSIIESKEFKKGKPLHILIHPVWWNENSLSAYDTLSRLVQEKTARIEKSIAKNCKIYRVGDLIKKK